MISFSSVQWIRNFVSGIYLLVIRPFGVGDFIELSKELSGEVVELSLNYTKIKTPNEIFHLVPNRLFLTHNITNYNSKIQRTIITLSEEKSKKGKDLRSFAQTLIEESVVCYTFTWGAPIDDLDQTKHKILHICEIYAGVFGFRPEFFLNDLDHRLQFTFIVTTLSAKILLKNIHDFFDDLAAEFF
ncbi:MAG: mechanosensitive ion channel domain-containing protein [Candidatus Hodarchaeales archaeon]